VEPDTVSKLAAHLDADPEAYAVCPLLMEDGEPASRPMKLPSRETLRAAVRGVPLPAMDLDLSASVVDVDYPGRTALMIRREFITGMNYIDKRYGHYWGDAELAVQIRRANKKIRLLTMIRAHLQDSGSTGSWRDDPVLAADYINGAVELAGKHFGGGVKLSAVLWTLGEALKSPFSGFAWTRFLRVLSGEKIDSGLK
jgi:GT2 family glycosyltransferase